MVSHSNDDRRPPSFRILETTSFKVAHVLRKATPRRFSAFTLVELVVVVTVLAILAVIGFLALSGYAEDAKNSSLVANIRSVQTAISSESALTNNSPRYYVVHNTGAALSGAFVYLDGTQIVLTGGSWDAPNANYSAGNPDYAKLKLNPEKFKVAFIGIPLFDKVSAAYGPWSYDSKYLAVGAMDYSAFSPNGRKRSWSYFQVAGIFPATGKVTVTGNYPETLSVSGSVVGLIDDPSGVTSTGALLDGTVTWVPVSGDCGTANNTAVNVKPATNLCASTPSSSTGNPSAVTGLGPWTWTCAGDYGGSAASCSANVAAYVVTFDPNGGDAPSPSTKPVAYNATVGTLATTTLAGHTFNGWFTAPVGGVQITAATVVTANVTWYAQWTSNSFFSGNGTSWSPWLKLDGTALKNCQEYNALATTKSDGTARWVGTCGNGSQACLSDGVYSMAPTGSQAGKFAAYCDMSTSWGGWTLLSNQVSYDGTNVYGVGNACTDLTANCWSDLGKLWNASLQYNKVKILHKNGKYVIFNLKRWGFFENMFTGWASYAGSTDATYVFEDSMLNRSWFTDLLIYWWANSGNNSLWLANNSYSSVNWYSYAFKWSSNCSSVGYSNGSSACVASWGYSIFVKNDGDTVGSSQYPWKTCKDIKSSGNSVGDGTYWIKPDGNPAFQAYCDMTTDWGGWTLVRKMKGDTIVGGQTTSANVPSLVNLNTDSANFADATWNNINPTQVWNVCNGYQTIYNRNVATPWASSAGAYASCSYNTNAWVSYQKNFWAAADTLFTYQGCGGGYSTTNANWGILSGIYSTSAHPGCYDASRDANTTSAAPAKFNNGAGMPLGWWWNGYVLIR